MAETAAFLMDEVFPKVPIRQWVLSFPFPLRYLMASNSKVQSAVLAITLRVITKQIRKKAKALGEKGRIEPGAVTLIQRFGSSINLNVHLHMLVLEGVYATGEEDPRWVEVTAPTDEVRRLGTMEECYYEEAELNGSRCAALGGFSLHANTAC